MKKVYISFLLIGSTATGFAQNTSTNRVPHKEGANLTAPSNKPATQVYEKALNVLWTEDFSGGAGALQTTNGQWTVEGSEGAFWDITTAAHPLSGFGWSHAMNGDHAQWNSYGPNANEPGGFASTPVMGALISPTIVLSGNTNSIGIQFLTETMYCCNYDETVRPFGISVSVDDGVSWSDTLRFDFGVDRNEATEDIAHPMTVGVNLDEIAPAGPQTQFKFKLIWDGDSPDGNGQYNTHYFWMLDDVAIYEIPDNDIALVAGYHNDIIMDWEYSTLPVTQSSAREMIPTLMVENQGIMDQTVDFTCEITDGTGSVVNTTVITQTIVAGTADTLYFQTGFMPSALGTYSTSFSIPADDDPSDDAMDASDLIVDEFLMGHDYGTAAEFSWDPAGNNSDLADAPHAYGNRYIPVVDQDVYGINVAFGSSMSEELFLIARIQEMTGTSIQDPLNIIAEVGHEVVAGEPGSIVTIPLSSAVTLTAGTDYIVDIYKIDGTQGMEFAIDGTSTNGEDDDYSTVNYGPYGQNSAVNYFSGWGYAPHVRLNFDMSLSVDENASLEGVSVYPNPSEGIINVSNDNNVAQTIEVRNMAGQLISIETVSTATTIDLTAEASGIYVVKVSNENGAMVEKVTIK